MKNTENALTLGDSDSAREKTGICILTGTLSNLYSDGPWITVYKTLPSTSVNTFVPIRCLTQLPEGVLIIF